VVEEKQGCGRQSTTSVCGAKTDVKLMLTGAKLMSFLRKVDYVLLRRAMTGALMTRI
jgi:hypothetical protein